MTTTLFDLVANIVVLSEHRGVQTTQDYYSIRNANQDGIREQLTELKKGAVFKVQGVEDPLLVIRVDDNEYPAPWNNSVRCKDRTFYCMRAWKIGETVDQYYPIDWFE